MLKYRPDIDGLRAIAVFSVIIFHAKLSIFDQNLLTGGFIGVDIFFVISGYLITSIILNQRKTKTFTFSLFYERRIRRILPALFLILYISTIFAYFLLLPGDLLEFSQTLLTTAFFSSNFFFWTHTGYFFTENELKPLIHTWSLSIEEQFYLIFPLVFIFIVKNLKRFIQFILFFTFFISLLIAELESKTGSTGSFYLLPTRGWEFLIGIYAALENEKLKNFFGKKTKNFLSFFGLILILFSIFTFKEEYVHPGLITLIPTFGTMLIILYSSSNFWCYKILSNKILVFNGLISYSLYLWHQPIFAFSKQIDHNFSTTEIILINLILTYIGAIFSWKYIETPFRNPKKVTKKILSFFCLISLFLFTISGIFLFKSDGLISNYNKSDFSLIKNENQYSQFVWKKSSDISLTNFPKNVNKNILVIGDSFSQDLVNSIFQSDLKKFINVSYIGINYKCSEKNKDINCLKLNIKNNEQIKKLINESDSIWLSMSWNEIDVKKILEIKNDLFNKKLIIFGKKYFVNENYTRKKLLKKSLIERQEIFSKVPTRVIDIEKKMKNSLDSEKFISLLDIFCNSNFECKLFNMDNELISYDGTHLTQEGAKFLGQRLFNNNKILKVINSF